MSAPAPTSHLAPEHCLVCKAGGDAQTHLFDKGSHPIFRCAECAGSYVFPLPSEEELKQLYDGEEWFEGGLVGGYENYDEQTQPSFDTVRSLLDSGPEGPKMVLDLGCGYGSHLQIAHELGWICHGVELSEHALGKARERLGSKALLAQELDQLPPARYDLILLLDVLEHLPDPQEILLDLFSRGAFSKDTRIVVSTPNAGSLSAQKDFANWQFLHPPSHLVFFNEKSLERLFADLHFESIQIRGVSPCAGTDPDSTPVDGSGPLENYEGLMIEASGSDFGGFIQERFLPGTFSCLTDYEHFPRYALVKELARGKKTLDFGCGTGYGSRILSEVAAEVTGLDISQDALAWARKKHRRKNLNFVRSETLGSELDPARFELITCFEMIEHVDQETQVQCLASLARMLRPEGLLVMSTPNPVVTAKYGENPYHIHEMPKEEFAEFLSSQFPHVRLLDQWIHPGVLFGDPDDPDLPARIQHPSAKEALPVAYLGFASHSPLPPLETFAWVDGARDFVDQYLELQRFQHQQSLQENELRIAQERIEGLQQEVLRLKSGTLVQRIAREVRRTMQRRFGGGEEPRG